MNQLKCTKTICTFSFVSTRLNTYFTVFVDVFIIAVVVNAELSCYCFLIIVVSVDVSVVMWRNVCDRVLSVGA